MYYFKRRDDCFGFADKYLRWLSGRRYLAKEINHLRGDVEALRFFVTYVRQAKSNGFFAGNDEDNSGEILPMIEDVISRIPSDLHSAYLTSASDYGALIKSYLIRCRGDIKFFGTVIKRRCISLIDKHYYFLGHHHQPLLDLFLSLSDCSSAMLRAEVDFELDFNFERLLYPTKFIHILIGFATTQLVDPMLLIDLLTHVDVAAAAHSAVCMIYRIWFDRDTSDGEESKQKQFVESRQLLQKLMPIFADPQLRETYIRILTASKLSMASTDIFSPQMQQQQQRNDGLKQANKFILLLLYNLAELLQSYTNLTLSVDDQMQKLYQGLRFLSILLLEKLEEFNALDDELKDLVGALIIDAGILICSLSLDELKQGLAKESDLALSHWLRVLQFIMSEAVQIHPSTSFSSPSSPSFCKTNELGCFDFLLQHLKELASTEADSIAFLKAQFHTIHDDLAFLRPFLENIAEQRYHDIELQTLWDSIMEVAHKAEFAIDLSIFHLVNDKPDCPPTSLSTITKEINSLKTKVLHSMRNVDTPYQGVTKTAIHIPMRVPTSASKFDAVLVGHHEELNTIIDGLTRGSDRLDTISIVGMPGLGKTTLATKVYNHPSITHHFHFQAWCTVSQIYTKRDLLVQIMGDVVSKNPNQYLSMDENDLAEKLFKHLKRKRYLIVLDDVWRVDALNLLKESFPDDENRSRLLITSRYQNLCSQFKVHKLPLLTNEESWELLQIKLFGGGCCPSALDILGKQIAEHCKGLPLTVVLVAGILANSEQNRWVDIGKGLSTIIEIEEQCRETLELSYKNLPDYLKPCLLYFVAFREDQDISVQSLLRLWISEGFIQYNKEKSLEEVANEYLMNLIGRSLVMVAKQRSVGGVKTCRVHDLLHEFCVKKAQEENFLHILHGFNEFFASTTLYNPRRLSVHNSKRLGNILKRSIFFPHLRSLLSSIGFLHHAFRSSVFPKNFMLLRVLSIKTPISMGDTFPEGVELLVHLRYLAIPCTQGSIPSGIANLTRLETFVIYLCNDNGVKLPNSIWYMKKLRHLHCESGFIFPTDNLEVVPDLYNLQSCTLHVDFSYESLHLIINKLPNIRRLKCVHLLFGNPVENFQGLDNLNILESLRMYGTFPCEFVFPTHLKKLTLIGSNKQWSEISAIGKLPNLEVLKLLNCSLVGETWEVREGEFPKLKFLKLSGLDICKWTINSSADDDFPCLEKLILRGCALLEGVPSCLGDIPSIKMIEVTDCSQSAIDSVMQIQEQQREVGNEDLQVTISSTGLEDLIQSLFNFNA